MIKHIVFLKFQDEPGGMTALESAQTMKKMLEGLVGVVPQIRYFEVGLNENPNEEVSIVLISHFDSWEDMHLYKIHPAHVAVGNFTNEGSRKVYRKAIDFEF